MTSELTLSIDVPDIDKGLEFFSKGLGFVIKNQLEKTVYELEFSGVRIFLLEKPEGSVPAPGAGARKYSRHWTPVHLDLEVSDIDRARRRALEAGATLERESSDEEWGRIATLADPFGNGFCLIQPPKTDR